MLSVILEEENKNIKHFIYINNDSCYGYTINNNKFLDLDINIIDMLKNINSSDIVYESNAVNYEKTTDEIENKIKKYKLLYKGVAFILIVETLYTVSNLPKLIKTKELNDIEIEFNYDELEVDDLINIINSSSNLNDEEKKLLINYKFFENILPYINENNYENELALRLTNVDICNFNESKYEILKRLNQKVTGFYNPIEYNRIFIRDYNENISDKKTTITHEFIHLLQQTNKYRLIKEGSANIVLNEYYEMPITNYKEEVKILKVLMEIIGPLPIWEYNFANDSSKLDYQIYNYLKYEDYKKFISYLNKNNINSEKDQKEINSLLAKMYYNKYNDSIKNNEIITAIYNDTVAHRNYFNIDDELEDVIYKTMSKEEALEKNLLKYHYVRTVEEEVLESEFEKDKSVHVKYQIKDGYEIYTDIDEELYITNEKGDLITFEDAYKKGILDKTYYKTNLIEVPTKDLNKYNDAYIVPYFIDDSCEFIYDEDTDDSYIIYDKHSVDKINYKYRNQKIRKME